MSSRDGVAQGIPVRLLRQELDAALVEQPLGAAVALRQAVRASPIAGSAGSLWRGLRALR